MLGRNSEDDMTSKYHRNNLPHDERCLHPGGHLSL